MRTVDYCADIDLRRVAESSSDLPHIELDGNGLLSAENRGVWVSFLKNVMDARQIGDLTSARDRLYSDSMSGGYTLFRGLSFAGVSEDVQKRVAFALCCFFGSPIHVFERRGVWHDVPVNLNAHPERYSGTGHNPFHIDVMNAVRPPELVAFHCIRRDPLGGGRNLISHIGEAYDALPVDCREALASERFVEGVFFQIRNAGGELDPYQVVEIGSDGRRIFRFTARGIKKQDSDRKRDLLIAMDKSLQTKAMVADLHPGDLLLLNQRVMTHAREPLGSPQEAIAPESRRLLRRLFMNFGNFI